jgi:AhpD family alkylhydroperoxidase
MTKYQEKLIELSTGMKKLSMEIPSVLQPYGTLISEIAKDSVLSGKEKELIALGIAINQRYDSCMLLHIMNALKNKATPQEIYETIGVSVVIGGGPAIIMGIKAMEIVRDLTNQTP